MYTWEPKPTGKHARVRLKETMNVCVSFKIPPIYCKGENHQPALSIKSHHPTNQTNQTWGRTVRNRNCRALERSAQRRDEDQKKRAFHSRSFTFSPAKRVSCLTSYLQLHLHLQLLLHLHLPGCAKGPLSLASFFGCPSYPPLP